MRMLRDQQGQREGLQVVAGSAVGEFVFVDVEVGVVEGGVWLNVRVAIGEPEGLIAIPMTFVRTRIGRDEGVYVLLVSELSVNVVY